MINPSEELLRFFSLPGDRYLEISLESYEESIRSAGLVLENIRKSLVTRTAFKCHGIFCDFIIPKNFVKPLEFKKEVVEVFRRQEADSLKASRRISRTKLTLHMLELYNSKIDLIQKRLEFMGVFKNKQQAASFPSFSLTDSQLRIQKIDQLLR